MATSTGQKVTLGTGVALVVGALIYHAATTTTCHPYRNCGGLYARADGAVRPLSGSPVGHFCGQVGSDHSTCYVMDFGEGKMEIFISSGALGPDGFPVYIAPAPIVDAPVEGHPETTVCAKYTNGNGPRAKPCPSGRTLAQYSADIEHSPWWSRPATCCGITPTPPPVPTVTAPFITQTPLPIPVVNPYAKQVEAVYRAGITAGCQQDPKMFCPTSTLTRQEAAVWFANALKLQLLPCENTFQDTKCQ